MTQIVYQLINEHFERAAFATPLNTSQVQRASVEVLDTGGPRYVLINGQPIGGVLDLEMPGDRPGPQVRITLLAEMVTMRQATLEECEARAVSVETVSC